MNKNKPILLVIIFFVSIVVKSQDIGGLDKLFERNRRGEYVGSELVNWLKKNTFNQEQVYLKYASKSNEDLLFYYYLLYNSILTSSNDGQKVEYLNYLISKGLNDPDPSNVSLVLTYLNDLPPQYFSSASKSTISSILLSNNLGLIKPLILLSGKLKITEVIPHLKSLLSDSLVNSSIKWKVNLALGRMGDIDNVKYCLNKVRDVGINDHVISFLFSDLIYLNNRLCYDYLLDQVLLENFNCTSTNPDNEVPIDCAYRLIELLAPCIEEFPVELYESGDIVSDDYKATLDSVREWIRENKYLYQIKYNY